MDKPQNQGDEREHVVSYVYSGQQKTDLPKDITHLDIHPSVTEIPPSTFQDFTSLVEVQCNEGLRTIGRFAFQSCNALRSISISSTVSRIEFRAFASCESLMDMGFPEGLLFIGDQAFFCCKSLTTMTIPSTVESIGEHAFDACLGLVEFIFHNSVVKKPGVRTIGAGIFFRCALLSHVELAEGVNLIPADAFTMCESLQTLAFPNSVEEIRDSAFDGCVSLVEVHFEEGLRVIYERAFAGCKALRTVSFPSTLISIEGGAFHECDCLVDVQFAEGLEYIGQEAFFECKMLSAISLPKSLETIDEDAFINCSSLLGVEFSNGINVKVCEGCFIECTSLVNVSIPPSMDLTTFYDVFLGCNLLHNENGDDTFSLQIQDRFSQLPVHNACYNASTTTVEELLTTLGSFTLQEGATDAYGMTPFHIIATSAQLRSDFMEILLDRYPVEVLAYKDRHKRTMMDYLLMHNSTKAIPLIKVVLSGLVADWMTGRMLRTQRQALLMLADSVCGHGNSSTRRGSFVEVSKSFTCYLQLEVTSIVEMALWKLMITQMEQNEPNGKADRASCRYKCEADVIIPNVSDFVWGDDSASCFAGLLPFGRIPESK